MNILMTVPFWQPLLLKTVSVVFREPKPDIKLNTIVIQLATNCGLSVYLVPSLTLDLQVNVQRHL